MEAAHSSSLFGLHAAEHNLRLDLDEGGLALVGDPELEGPYASVGGHDRISAEQDLHTGSRKACKHQPRPERQTKQADNRLDRHHDVGRKRDRDHVPIAHRRHRVDAKEKRSPECAGVRPRGGGLDGARPTGDVGKRRTRRWPQNSRLRSATAKAGHDMVRSSLYRLSDDFRPSPLRAVLKHPSRLSRRILLLVATTEQIPGRGTEPVILGVCRSCRHYLLCVSVARDG